MSEQASDRTTAITEAAQAANALSPNVIARLADVTPALDTLSPAETVAEMKRIHPDLFRPPAREMTQADADRQLRRLGVDPSRIRRR
jgi:hypothetical protein